MKHIILILSVFIISGCTNFEFDKTQTIYSSDNSGDLKIYVIDSCEYVGRFSGFTDSDIITHKGNCKFCTIRNKK